MKFNLPKLNRRIVLIGIGLIVLMIALIVLVPMFTTPQAAPLVVVTVQRGDISASINATGKVVSKKSARLSLPISGVVQSISKHEGDKVNPGDVILTLRSDETTRRVRQAELVLASRQLDLARAKAAPRDEDIQVARANLDKATLNVAITEANYNATSSPQADAARQSARIDLDIARANFTRVTNGPTQEELQQLQNNVIAAQIDLDNANTALAMTRLTAPYTATVTEITVREGEISGYSPLATIADLTALEIDADVDEINVANVAVGQSVEVRLDAFPGEKLSGKLTRLFPAASTQRGTTVYPAVVEFDPKNFQVRLGMGANLKILTVEKKNVLVVPNRALKSVGTRKAVHIVAPGAPRDVFVETGVTDGNNTEIVSGLNEGDQIDLQ